MPRPKRAQLPGPRPLPLVGNLPRFYGHGLLGPYLGDWREYGDVLRYRFGPREAVMLCHPDHLRQIFIKHKNDVRRLIDNGSVKQTKVKVCFVFVCIHLLYPVEFPSFPYRR